MKKGQTDSTFFYDKVRLRLDHLPDKDKISVLDCFCGEGTIWKAVQKETKRNIKVLGIDKKNYKTVDLVGDNVKYLEGMDLNMFDVIDLDAYGMPIRQLELLFSRGLKDKIIYVTYIQVGMGSISRKLLVSLGYTKVMINKVPTLFFRDGREKFLHYLAVHGVKRVCMRSKNRYNYLVFKI